MFHFLPRSSALCLGLLVALARVQADEKPFLTSELIFTPEHWHCHASCVVELPNGELLATWFKGSGERTADDVVIEGARLKKGSRRWSPRFVMADTPDFPDGNPCLLVDATGKLWFIHTTIQANTWESALLKVRTTRNLGRSGSPKWETSEVLHVKPGPEFEAEIERRLPELEATIGRLKLTDREKREAQEFLEAMKAHATDKLYRRLGWMTRAHPIELKDRTLIVPLYHDGFSVSLMVLSRDGGNTWETSAPLVGAGNIQPSVVPRADGSLYALMRDNGPPPKRLMQSESRDNGLTWGAVTDSDQINSGAGAEIIRLRNGNWVLINNDTEDDRFQLAVSMSDDEGRTWKWKRYLEKDTPGPEAGRFHYPSIIQAKDGSLHATYSHHLHQANLPKDVDGDPAAKSIKHAHFNEAWIKAGTP